MNQAQSISAGIAPVRCVVCHNRVLKLFIWHPDEPDESLVSICADCGWVGKLDGLLREARALAL